MYFETSSETGKNLKGLRNWVLQHSLKNHRKIESRRYYKVFTKEEIEKGRDRMCGLGSSDGKSAC